MAVLGSPNYRVGLIIARSQPFHNGHLKAITDAIMYCDEVIFSIRNYNTSFFDYNIAQKLYRKLFKLVDRVAFFGTEEDPLLGTPKHFINRTLERLEYSNYHMPTHFFTNNDLWVEPAKELQLETIKVTTLANHNSDEILNSIVDGTDLWKEKVPYALIEDIETYIITKNNSL
jgi:hypothetical protein